VGGCAAFAHARAKAASVRACVRAFARVHAADAAEADTKKTELGVGQFAERMTVSDRVDLVSHRRLSQLQLLTLLWHDRRVRANVENVVHLRAVRIRWVVVHFSASIDGFWVAFLPPEAARRTNVRGAYSASRGLRSNEWSPRANTQSCTLRTSSSDESRTSPNTRAIEQPLTLRGGLMMYSECSHSFGIFGYIGGIEGGVLWKGAVEECGWHLWNERVCSRSSTSPAGFGRITH
jgi:hypothetical protein